MRACQINLEFSMPVSQNPAQREAVPESLKKARDAWNAAPGHVKTMAGRYIEPLLDSLQLVIDEITSLRAQLDSINQQMAGFAAAHKIGGAQ